MIGRQVALAQLRATVYQDFGMHVKIHPTEADH
jgi:hypothetical protein